jgi:hypothetical protein
MVPYYNLLSGAVLIVVLPSHILCFIWLHAALLLWEANILSAVVEIVCHLCITKVYYDIPKIPHLDTALS